MAVIAENQGGDIEAKKPQRNRVASSRARAAAAAEKAAPPMVAPEEETPPPPAASARRDDDRGEFGVSGETEALLGVPGSSLCRVCVAREFVIVVSWEEGKRRE